ncbi:FAD/FMN-containing dehydrogenase [Kribbella sp. VKM Ac-2527]|uniref:FAD/FMN-containing dehydrogenase n=1 Tax=Kribbella caucasensis TaxID=2512215 RepID=A0A4R6K697_9ACTN|nr:FAD-binding oxidoreductase [Kribbella sp. VKM Ac-2527]TDO44936.1 FAD/FMN-containing dehydrogenase [Kribbella sp. VKM Ac-2527]
MTEVMIRGFDGVLLRPHDSGYDAGRAVWNAVVDRRPALIAKCASTADVVAALRYGREAGLEIGVRCGGHSFLGLPVVEDGLLIDLSGLSAVRVDPGSRRAWVGGGALLGALDVAAQRYGLATTAGNVSHTGVGGLTLGGGIGWLARLHGLSCDNVASFELVTADGDVLRVSETEHPDLFWGLRGGGGNFGVVTEFEFRLHPVGTRALVADLIYELDDAGTALRGWRDLFADTPRRATPVARVGRRDDDRGGGAGKESRLARPMASIGYVWVGDPDEGRRLLASYSRIGRPVAQQVRELSYLDLQTGDDDVEGHAMRRYCKDHYLRELPDAAIDAFLAWDNDPFRPGARMTLNGGAIADEPDEDSAFSHRDALVEFTTAAGWTNPAEDGPRIAAARRYAAGLEPYASGAYVNTFADQDDSALRRAYSPAKLARLRDLKRAYDPANIFHRTTNIRP